MRPLYKEEKAFTVFETLIVVTIIGLIMAIVLPNYIDARNRTRENVCASNQKVIYTAAAMYTMAEPESLEDMGDKERLDALVEAQYIKHNGWYECPSSNDDDFDDYTMTFNDGEVTDIECDEMRSQHPWL